MPNTGSPDDWSCGRAGDQNRHDGQHVVAVADGLGQTEAVPEPRLRMIESAVGPAGTVWSWESR